MKVITEDIYGQIMQYDVAKDSYISKERLKTTLKTFAFNYLDIFAFLELDKGQGIVLINHDYYNNSLRKIFDDSAKFKKGTIVNT